MFFVPCYGITKSIFKGHFSLPSQLFCNLAGIGGVAKIVARAIGDKSDAIFGQIEKVEHATSDFQIRMLFVGAHVVNFTQFSFVQNQINRPAVI